MALVLSLLGAFLHIECIFALQYRVHIRQSPPLRGIPRLHNGQLPIGRNVTLPIELRRHEK